MLTYERRPARFKALRHFAAAAVALASAWSAIGDPLSESDIVEAEGGQAIPSWFLGAWERESIRRGGVTENAVSVHYLQTPTMFGDIRIPSARRTSSHAQSLADLTDTELTSLEDQQGFFGYTTIANDIATWHHEIDYQPADGSDDRGRIERVGASSMYEHALDASYVEHWWSLASGDSKYLAVRVTTQDHGVERLDRVLLVAGDHFAYARNRRQDLPRAASLNELISTSHAPRERVLGYLDCEPLARLRARRQGPLGNRGFHAPLA